MRHSKKSQYKDIAERVIYLLLFPATKEFFIFHCPKKSVRDYYRQHMHGTYYKTKQRVEDLKKQNLRPCFFILEEVTTTKVDAFNYVIVWTKIFSEAGYEGLDHGNVSVYKDDLLDRNVALYNARKDSDLSGKLICEHCLVKIYNHAHCRNALDYMATDETTSKKNKRDNEKIQLSIRVPEDEYERIKKNAQACGQSISAYLTQNALEMKILELDLNIIAETAAKIHEHRMAAMQLIYTIKKTNNFVPQDLEYILEKTNMILKIQKDSLKNYEEHIHKERKRIKKEIQEIVNERIQGGNRNKRKSE